MKRVLSHPLVALAAGLALRLFFVLKSPATSGDTPLYEELATNWVKHGAYALSLNDVITPVDVRMPGYPAILALIYLMTGRSGEAARLPVMLLQIAADLLCSIAIARIASSLVKLTFGPDPSKRVFTLALWLAALCPFTADYTAVILTETLATLFSAITIYFLVRLAESHTELFHPSNRLKASWDKTSAHWAAFFGLTVGATTLFRPESPLLLVVAWIVLAMSFVKHGEFLRWLKLASLSGLLCFLVLLPWTIRNAVALHEFQPLAPKDATLPSERPPTGFMAWERSWLYRMSECYAVTWKLNEENINLADIPARAFDSESEKEHVARLIERHNKNNNLSAEADSEFGVIAKRRTAQHPLRTYLVIPFQRVLTIWFTPRIELLPYNGTVFPLADEWENDRPDLVVTLFFFFLDIFYLLAAICGAWKLWESSGRVRLALAAILAYVVIRTAFLTTVEAPEPRYVLVCFPAILALATVAFLKRSGAPNTIHPPT